MPDSFVDGPVKGGTRRFPIVFEGADRTFTMTPGRIEAQLVSPMNPLLRDLLEVACSVFAADSEFSRGGPVRKDMGEAWSRDFAFTLAVRRPDIWNNPEVRQALVEAVEFLTGDRTAFQFVAKEDKIHPIEFLPFEASESPFHGAEVILFSGGLDSFAGALEALSTRDDKVVLVTHRSAQKAITRQVDLGAYLADNFPGRVLHIQVQAIRKGHESRESTQRSRSLLFAALGYATAQMLGASKVSFYENGVVSHNLPISPQVIGTMATRTTHPLALVKLERLLHALDDNRIPIRNGFEWLTKKDVVEKIATYGASDRISNAVSCTRLRDQDSLKTHCGECSQCLDRRFAILAAGLQRYDEDFRYGTDVLRGPRDTDQSRTMALDWSRHAWRLADLDVDEFYTTFTSELSRVLEGHPRLMPAEVLRRTHAMQQRHAEVVRSVFLQEAEGVFNPDVPETSLLKMFRAERLEDGAAVGATATASQATKYDGPFVNVAQFRPDQPEVAFYKDRKTKVVEIAGLGAVRGATATVPHALKPAFEEDRDAGLGASEFRYTPLRELARAAEVSKGAVHQRVSRCRRAFSDFYSGLSDEPLPDEFLIQIKERDGYRLDPQIRIIGRPQLGEREVAACTDRPARATSAESDDRSAHGG